MSFEIKPNRIDTESEIISLIQENAPITPNATPTSRGILFGKTLANTSQGESLNTSLGYDSLKFSTSGSGNVAVGYSALRVPTAPSMNVAIGFKSQEYFDGQNSIAIGNEAMKTSNGGSYNVAIGDNALYGSLTPTDVIAIGRESLSSSIGGNSNIGLGSYTLRTNSGNHNIAIGYKAGENTSNIDNNIFVGYESGKRSLSSSSVYIGLNAGVDARGSNNVAIGAGAYSTEWFTGENNICIGYNSTPSGQSVSNTITLGNSSITQLRCAVTSITAISDSRDKKNIEPLSPGLELVNKLKPVQFDWNMRDGSKVDVPDIGFIAQDLMLLEDESGITDYLKLTYRENPDKLEASYGRLIPILVKAIQDLSKEVESLKNKN